MRSECTLLGDQRIKGLLLSRELRSECLLLCEGVIKWITTNRPSLCQAETNDEKGDGEQDANSGAPGACAVRRRRRVLHV